MNDIKNKDIKNRKKTLTIVFGIPVGDDWNCQTPGGRLPILM
jgi:hypothetical protein